MLVQLVGGIGLFLLGMVLLTDGLKTFAGDALRRALVQFTGRPIKAFASGALVTALVQSSSATTVTVIGFVSAGLLTFPQALGVVIGASLGTTGTGWIVALVGLRISVGYYALPIVGAGAFIRLLARGRWRSLGVALAGFGLIFLGIEALQGGMEGLAGRFQLGELPADRLLGRFLLILTGIAMTVVMQSSSAAVATTLTALHANYIDFEQASLLVIGAAIGTTVTGAIAAIGASISAKRTALAHVVFNLATGVIAVLMLPAFLWSIQRFHLQLGLELGATSLAAFHTAFIAVGVVVFLPLVHPFARWIERMLPETGSPLTRHLDSSVLNVPAVALEATRRALSETACEMFAVARARLSGRPQDDEARAEQLEEALHQVQHFFARIPPLAEDQPMSRSRVAQMHAIDHLARLLPRLKPPAAYWTVAAHHLLQDEVALTRGLLQLAEAGLRGQAPADWLESVERQSLELLELRRGQRKAVLRKTAEGNWQPARALDALDAMRWLDRLGYHTWRACNYLAGQGTPELAEEETEAGSDE